MSMVLKKSHAAPYCNSQSQCSDLQKSSKPLAMNPASRAIASDSSRPFVYYGAVLGHSGGLSRHAIDSFRSLGKRKTGDSLCRWQTQRLVRALHGLELWFFQ